MATKTKEQKPETADSKPKFTGVKPITRRQPKQENEPAEETSTAETVSLIDKPEKKKSPPASAKSLPPISQIQEQREHDKRATAAPEPKEESEAEDSPVTVTESGEKVIHLKPPIVVKDLARHMDVKPHVLMKDLMDMQIFAKITQTLEPDVISALCERHGFIFEKERREKGAGVHKQEEIIEAPAPPEEVAEEDLHSRAPVVTFMGHVDHGKTSLLDKIREAKVAAGEAGGITQHIGAYTVEKNGQPITFLDTPGHAAFTQMRARGANVTDIVVLVIAADDGIMPQTEEALNHARAAKSKIIIALNKIDLPTAQPEKVKGQLQERGLSPEDWGGETICVPVSAATGEGIDQLLDAILLEAEILELKAPEKVPGRGHVIEAQFEAGRGPTGTVIVEMGKLKVGQPFICGNYWGKIKSLINYSGKNVKEAGPASAIKVLGFNGLPAAGDEFLIMESERDARTLSEERLAAKRHEKLATPQRATLEDLMASFEEGTKKALKIVLKSDVQGSLEALQDSLRQIESGKVDLDIIHAAVGPVSESDVLLASASDAVIIGFGIKVDGAASRAAKREGVQIKLYSIIYELIDQIKEAMAGLLEPETRESVLGHAEVKKVFALTRGKVGGCIVNDGRIVRTARARVKRGRNPVYDGGIATLRRFQDEVKEVRAGLECGIKLGDFNDYEEGDIIECYQLEKVPQQL